MIKEVIIIFITAFALSLILTPLSIKLAPKVGAVDVPKDSSVATDEEIFGPVFPVIGFETLEEAIAIANNSCYGLSSGILSKDMKKAMAFALAVDSGACVVGGNGNYRLTQQPFNGHKMSGVGSEGTMYTLHEMVKVKTIVLKDVF